MHAEEPGSRGYNQMVKAAISGGQSRLPTEIPAKMHQEAQSLTRVSITSLSGLHRLSPVTRKLEVIRQNVRSARLKTLKDIGPSTAERFQTGED